MFSWTRTIINWMNNNSETVWMCVCVCVCVCRSTVEWNNENHWPETNCSFQNYAGSACLDSSLVFTWGVGSAHEHKTSGSILPKWSTCFCSIWRAAVVFHVSVSQRQLVTKNMRPWSKPTHCHVSYINCLFSFFYVQQKNQALNSVLLKSAWFM